MSSGWSMEGEFAVHQMEAGKIAAPLLAGGRSTARGVLHERAAPQRLILNSQLEGNFTIQRGRSPNVDMTRLLQGSGSGGGTTLFSEMSGSVSADSNRLLVRQIRMAAGLLNAAGQVEMDPQKNLSGRMQVELRARASRRARCSRLRALCRIHNSAAAIELAGAGIEGPV